jgi:hypothetical protein
MEKGKDTPKEKLLEACGTEQPPAAPSAVLGQQRDKYFEAMLAKADIAVKLAQQAQGETEKNYQKLDTFLVQQLPGRLESTFEQVAKKQVDQTLAPLASGIHEVIAVLNQCTEAAGSMLFIKNYALAGVLTGIATVSMGTWLVRHTVLDPIFAEERRYELYGRKVAATIEKYQPKDREKLYSLVGGRP